MELVSSEECDQVAHMSGQVHHEGVQGHQQEDGDHDIWGKSEGGNANHRHCALPRLGLRILFPE